MRKLIVANCVSVEGFLACDNHVRLWNTFARPDDAYSRAYDWLWGAFAPHFITPASGALRAG